MTSGANNSAGGTFYLVVSINSRRSSRLTRHLFPKDVDARQAAMPEESGAGNGRRDTRLWSANCTGLWKQLEPTQKDILIQYIEDLFEEMGRAEKMYYRSGVKDGLRLHHFVRKLK